MNYYTIRDLPNTTSKWAKNEEVKAHVFRVFKARRIKIPLEKIPWPYNSRMSLGVWLSAQDGRKERELFQDFFKDCLSSIDIDPNDWFHQKDTEKNEMKLENQAKQLMEEIADETNNARKRLPKFITNCFINHMQNSLKAWISKLENLLKRSPTTFNDSAYQDLFQAFVQLFGLSCWPGDVEKFEIPYEIWSEDESNTTLSGIRSKPDLVLYRHDLSHGYPRAGPMAIVKVKGPLSLRKRKKMMPRGMKRTLSATIDRPRELQPPQSSEPRAKCVKFENEANSGACERAAVTSLASKEEDRSEAELRDVSSPALGTYSANIGDQISHPEQMGSHNKQLNYEEVYYGELPSHACIPSQQEKKRWNDFLPQLLGEVVAAGYLQKDSNKNFLWNSSQWIFCNFPEFYLPRNVPVR